MNGAQSRKRGFTPPREASYIYSILKFHHLPSEKHLWLFLKSRASHGLTVSRLLFLALMVELLNLMAWLSEASLEAPSPGDLH